MKADLIEEYESSIGSYYSDNLTGLYSHGFFHEYLDQELKKSMRYHDPFTLILVDVDFFSQYNAANGSIKGDLLLRQIANIISENLRESDLAARYLSDVFAVLLTRCDAENAFPIAERIRQSIESRMEGVATVSIGLTTYLINTTTNKNALLSEAQEALLQAKKMGKNKVALYDKKNASEDDNKSQILIVDDEDRNLRLLEAMLLPLGYEVVKASNGEQALSLVKKLDIDLILLDIMMPGMNGFEVCKHLKENNDTRLIPVVVVTALDDKESKIKAIDAGADDFLTKPPDKTELLARTKSLVKMKQLNKNFTSIENVIFSLANTVEAKDGYTHGHVERVSNMAVSLGTRLGLSRKEIDALRLGGALHDIGKIAVPGNIINKPGSLSTDEWDTMKDHATAGYKICNPLMETLGLALKVIRHHHEKLDGSGYPDGLKGDEIPKIAQVMAVVDIYDALVTDRSYRKGMDKERALSILREEVAKGKLDKGIIDMLEEMIDEKTP
jgi:putative two-component system response regulator